MRQYLGIMIEVQGRHVDCTLTCGLEGVCDIRYIDIHELGNSEIEGGWLFTHSDWDDFATEIVKNALKTTPYDIIWEECM